MSKKIIKLVDIVVDEVVEQMGPGLFLTDECRADLTKKLAKRATQSEERSADIIQYLETEALAAICWFIKDFFKTILK